MTAFDNNTFCRAFAAIPTLNGNGLHTGGISGFLKSIGYAIKLLRPTKCIVVFDGQGGSVRRKAIFPEYKHRRSNKVRLNRIYENNSTTESESQAMVRQLVRVSQYIDTLPLTTIQMDSIEADDVIAFLALQSFAKSNVVIMSADKDFYQLINNRIKVYSPTKKKLYGEQEVLAEYGVSTANFILYKTLCGDKSDNIDGIPGCGGKTILKCFPFLAESNVYGTNDLISYAEEHSGKYKVYTNLLENKLLLARNYKLMQLSDTLIATFAQLNIGDRLEQSNTTLDRFTFNNMLRNDLLHNAIPNSMVWLEEVFGNLNRFTL